MNKRNSKRSRNCNAVKNISEAAWREALENLERFLYWRLRHLTNGGAFSEETLGMPAVEYYKATACEKLLTGEWRWDRRKTPTRQLIVIASSMISKRVRQYERTPKMVDIDTLRDELVEEEADDIVETAYEIAAERVKGIKELEEYLWAVREYNNYEEIAVHLDIPIREVYQRQRRLLRRVQLK